MSIAWKFTNRSICNPNKMEELHKHSNLYTIGNFKWLLVIVMIIVYLSIVWCVTLRLWPLDIPNHVEYSSSDKYIAEGIPKQIWTFWNNDRVPEVVTKCINTWRKQCPDYTITVLTPTNLHMHVSNAKEILGLSFSDTPQRLADFVRLHVLFEHGGYWMDSSIIMFRPLDMFSTHQRRLRTEFVGYYLESFTVDPRFPVIENWFFGCVKHSTFVAQWRDEFMRINTYRSSMTYVDHIRMHGIDLSGIPYHLSYYLSMHVAAQVVIQHHNYPMDRCFLQKAENGPLKYLNTNNWNSKKAVRHLLRTMKSGNVDTTFVKLRGSERKLVQHDKDILLMLDSLS